MIIKEGRLSYNYGISQVFLPNVSLIKVSIGQERFHAVSKLYVRGAFGCIIASDITSEDSLNSALTWKEVIEKNSDLIDGEPIPLILVQNKIDLLDDLGKIETFQTNDFLQEFSKKNNFCAAFQVSAKLDINLKTSIDRLLEQILKRNIFSSVSNENFAAKSDTKSVRNTIKLSTISHQANNTQTKNKSCC